MTDEQRAHARRPMAHDLVVEDLHTEKVLGSLVNLSEEGMMLLMDEPIEPARVIQCRIRLNEPCEGIAELALGVESLWCQPTDEPGHFWAGYQIIDISDETAAILDKVLGRA
ncbi:PilZ domain-containing protein [Thiohalobacter sp.]|uniref:PilZ domain-containing protein n=1 Tax=Thiohalobacter sp. TaxID=2025948 RepID=UPI002635F9DC|nr:PilZ domain-containing protein [Thiohalobacter sp.]